MTQLEQKQQEYIDLLTNQVMDLSMMSKIELGDNVILQIRELKHEIEHLNQYSVPFMTR
jgi:hypothetical protein